MQTVLPSHNSKTNRTSTLSTGGRQEGVGRGGEEDDEEEEEWVYNISEQQCTIEKSERATRAEK